MLGGLFAGAAAPSAAIAATPPAPTADFSDPTYHFLNRILWSVRPADLALARRIGVHAYLEQQLAPATVARGARVRVATVMALPRKTIYRVFKNPYDAAESGLVFSMIQRAVYSPAQLYERVVEFWSDHFNIDKQDREPEVVDWLRTVIRPLALGKFRTLLQATARHPAMLNYLNNEDSDKDHPNENYAREVMELHTLGVGTGYTEDDVKNVARAFTGWTADYTPYGGFIFDPNIHDTDPKVVLNTSIPAQPGLAGMKEGMQVLDLLASDRRTALFICRKLCVRYISDAFANPGPNEPAPITATVAALADVWQAHDGDMRAVLRALFATDAFAGSAQQKLRRPLDFLIAARRATGTTYLTENQQEYHVELLDQVPYGWGPPSGYPDVAGAWANTSSMLGRWSVAQDLASDALPANHSNMRTFYQQFLKGVTTVGGLIDRLAQNFFAATLPDSTRTPLIAYVTGGTGSAATPLTHDLLTDKLGPLAGLILSTPHFQWR